MLSIIFNSFSVHFIFPVPARNESFLLHMLRFYIQSVVAFFIRLKYLCPNSWGVEKLSIWSLHPSLKPKCHVWDWSSDGATQRKQLGSGDTDPHPIGIC